MAGHYPLSKETESKVFDSVARIGKYIARAIRYTKELRTPFAKMFIYRKEVMRLSDDYTIMDENIQEAEYAFTIGKYSLQDKEFWGKENKSIIKDTTLECHFDNNGDVVNIYLVA